MTKTTTTTDLDLSLPGLVEAHRSLHEGLAAELRQLSPEEYATPQGEFWSPAEHLDHLIRCVTPLVDALKLPRLVLRMRFGRPVESSSYEDVTARYLGRIAEGAGARGAYVPKARIGGREQQEKTLDHWIRLGRRLSSALESWNDRDLDRANLPHPLLGKLRIREIVAWSWFHGEHHRRRIQERRESHPE